MATTKIYHKDGSLLLEVETEQENNLQGADLKYANLRGADLQGAILQGAELQYADLQGAILQGAILRGADLKYANLKCANLRCAILRGANLRGADLQYADLRGADLQGAILQGAELQYADLLYSSGLRFLQLSGIGSANRQTLYLFDYDVVFCGCFRGSLDKFRERIDKTYTEGVYRIQYMALITLIGTLKSEYEANNKNS